MDKKIAILQSNYIPWKGYFDIIRNVDEFIIYDHVQFTKNDWRNRNIIKTQNGCEWLTIPVYRFNLQQKINETKISNTNWTKKHWNSIQNSYAKAEYFYKYKEIFEDLYLNQLQRVSLLSDINATFIRQINKILNINSKISFSADYSLMAGKNEALVNLCKQAKAKKYISGLAAKNYINESLFATENIEVQWIDYCRYPEYTQLHGAFQHNVSILDLIFNEGPHAKKYLKDFTK
jgi:hypothetical protein